MATDIYLFRNGPNLGDNYHLFKNQLLNYNINDSNEKINIIFVPINYLKKNITHKYIKKIKNNDHNKLKSLVKYILNCDCEIDFFVIENHNIEENKFLLKDSNNISVSLGNDINKPKYMKIELYNEIKDYIIKNSKKDYIFNIIDYPMSLKEANEILSKSELFISNHSGLLFMSYENKCPCLIYNPTHQKGFTNSINSYHFDDIKSFIIQYNNYNTMKNYTINKFGIVNQINVNDFTYDNTYIKLLKSSDDIQKIRLEYIKSIFGNKKLKCLEFGPGNGHFIEYNKKVNSNLYIDGFDIVDTPYSTVDKETALKTKYDIVLLYDVLEHFSNMNTLFDYTFDYAIISSPYMESFKWFSQNHKYWHHFKPNEHLYYFNEFGIQKWVESNNYKLIDFNFIEDEIRKPIITEKNICTYLIKSCKL